MSQWYADLDQAELGRGANLTVVSEHQVVRVITSDTLSIQRPDGQRLTAFVQDRTAGRIRLVLQDGRRVSLRLGFDEAFDPVGPGAPFSRQKWLIN